MTLVVLMPVYDDWEVAERAAAGLARRGTAATTPKLVAVALDGPIRRVRLAAD